MSFRSLRSFSQYRVTRDSGGLPLSHGTTVTFITSVLFPFAPDRQRQCWKHQWKTNTYAVTRNPPAKHLGRQKALQHTLLAHSICKNVHDEAQVAAAQISESDTPFNTAQEVAKARVEWQWIHEGVDFPADSYAFKKTCVTQCASICLERAAPLRIALKQTNNWSVLRQASVLSM